MFDDDVSALDQEIEKHLLSSLGVKQEKIEQPVAIAPVQVVDEEQNDVNPISIKQEPESNNNLFHGLVVLENKDQPPVSMSEKKGTDKIIAETSLQDNSVRSPIETDSEQSPTGQSTQKDISNI